LKPQASGLNAPDTPDTQLQSAQPQRDDSDVFLSCPKRSDRKRVKSRIFHNSTPRFWVYYGILTNVV
jgi:hypothetical protein